MQIQALRESAGLSKADVARHLGVDLSAVCHWESGKAIPRADKLPEMADLFGCTIDALFGRNSHDGKSA